MKIRYIATTGVLLLGIVASSVRPASAASCPTPIAHRGNAYYGSPIGNSMNAFTTSYAVGSKWVESDLQFTVDDVPVLMHSRTVDSTTSGTGAIASMTAEQFTSLIMDDGQHPPTFSQLLDLVRSNPEHRAIVELKTVLTSSQEQILVGMLVGLEDRVYLNAFNDRLSSLQNLKNANPLLHTSLLVYSPITSVPSGIEAIDVDYTYLTATNVSRLHAAGLLVRAWTPNSATVWDRMKSYGVDAIMTNKVKGLVEWVATVCGDEGPDGNPGEGSEPTVQEYVLNQGFETDLSGWSMATTLSHNTRVAGGYQGQYSVRSINNSTTTAKHGIAGKPIDGVATTTTAMTPYTASVWVKPDSTGQSISIYIKETNSAKQTLASKTITVTAQTTEWQQLTDVYTAVGSGNAISMHVFATNSASQAGFLADGVSFSRTITPNI